MSNHIREVFEQISAPSFGHELTFPRNTKNEYTNPILEDHWQTFQEGWDSAMNYVKQKYNLDFSDVVSDGGMDPR